METKCTECDGVIRIEDDSFVGELITCPDCGTSFEITSIKGSITLTRAEAIAEDWGE